MAKYRLFTLFALGFLGGVLFVSFVNFDLVALWPILMVAFLSLVFVAFVNFVLKNNLLVTIAFVLISFMVGAVYFAWFSGRTAFPWRYGEEAEVVGKIAERPVLEIGGQQLILQVTEVDHKQVDKSKNLKILVKAPRFPYYEYGEAVMVQGKVSQPLLIEDFDYGRYLKKYPLYATITQPKKTEIIAPGTGLPDSALRSLYRLAASMEKSLNQVLPEPHASLAAGIIFGQKRNLSDQFKQELATTGLTHLVALSGYNVTILVTAITGLCLMRFGRRKSFWLGLLTVAFFVLMTGAAPSIMRAAYFSLLIIFGRTIGRQGEQTNIMLLAAILLILVNPFLLSYDVSFQLSFLAFAGLIYVSPVVKSFLLPYHFMPEYISGVLSETLGAQIAVLPLMLFAFKQISFISPLTNVLVLWIVPLVMLLSFLVAILGLFVLPLAKIAALLLWPTLQYMIKTIDFFASVPHAAVNLTKVFWLIPLSLSVVVAVLIIVFRKRIPVVSS